MDTNKPLESIFFNYIIGENEREKIGIQRVIESFDCVMWKNMIMKDKNTKPQHDPLYNLNNELPKINNTLIRECNYCHKKGDIQFKRCSRCKKTLYCSKECQVKDWSKHKLECKVNDEKEREAHQIKLDPSPADKQSQFLDNYERAIEKAKWVKENSKNMTDEERRKAAAEATMNIINLLEQDPNANEEEEEEEEKDKTQ